MVKRLISGIILIPIVVAIILYAPFWVIAALAALLIAGAVKELMHINEKMGYSGSAALAIVFSASIPFIFLYAGLADALRASVAYVFIYFLTGIYARKDFKASANWVMSKILALLYIAVPVAHIVPLTGLENGRLWFLFSLVLVWSNDTFAYFTGKAIGKHKLAPVLSPGKSIEGLVGGLLGGVIASLCMNYFLGLGLYHYEVALLTLGLGVVSVYGDLFESLLKRASGVKDSGNLIPGHGGLLDRIDSMVFVVPALYYYLELRNLLS
ncbi:MAG: phosphatidate cytidylyltransferase [Deltaproteobacteria bacterium]|nr:phosphatidate cytidylyltransferase [Deltaproteobacteria bacterium]